MKIDFRKIEQLLCAEFRDHGIEIENISGDSFAVFPDGVLFDGFPASKLLPLTAISERIAMELAEEVE